ncbi:PWWP domain-containing protein2 [Hypsizygus marmoreus]|uniref:PWWP domain-containing protein2 n=1 Tax=Hypsizygus marmoreus TaxID=39966 RepID=A0A369J6Q2_HYPMA|nr:PWWP domain-containing protein2 [Hypsizygus marmoreus]
MSKKGAKAAPKEVSSYEERDIVLGKVRGYPAWPGMVVDPESVPSSVQEERPSKKTKFYCVQFFPAGDYAWLVAKDISKLQQYEIESYINEPHKKSGDLLAGYRVALDPTTWEEERANLSQEAYQAEEEANAEVDELQSDDADSTKKQAKSKKRKRDSDVAPPAKTRKAVKPKKEPSEAPKKKGPAKGKKNGGKSKTLVESEDEGEAEAEAEDEDAGPSKKASPPPAKRAKREKEDEGDDAKLQDDPEALKVREWRHRLQKAFLGKTVPEEADMPTLDALFSTVESYDKISVQYLQFSKIGKVMRHITLLTDDKIPRDDEFHFRDRAKALVDRWHQVLNANKTNGSESGAVTATAPTNGAAKEKKEKETKEGTAESGEKTVTEGAAAIDLNGKAEDAMADADADAVGDTSMLGDVTMSEA